MRKRDFAIGSILLGIVIALACGEQQRGSENQQVAAPQEEGSNGGGVPAGALAA